MGYVSPYQNPGWSDAVWDVSGAFVDDRELIAFHDFCHLLLGFTPFNIVHGAPLCLWNSGRVLKHMICDTDQIRSAGLEYEKRNIAIYYTFTNLLLQEKHLSDLLGNSLLRFADDHNPTGNNAVILANDLLYQHVRREYPKLKLVSSILKITSAGNKRTVDTYRQLADQYDEIMVHPDDALNFKLLEQLEDKERYIILINEYCIRQCPIRAYHYKNLSQASMDFLGHDSADFDKRQSTNGCRDLGTLLFSDKHSVLALNTLEIQQLRDLGFRHFKLQGRGHMNSAPLLFDLMRLIWRNDAPTENAMHALCQRFGESILPHEAT